MRGQLYLIIFLMGLTTSYSKAEGPRGRPAQWTTLDKKHFLCEVRSQTGPAVNLELEISLDQHTQGRKEQLVLWNFNELIGQNDINNLHEELISNLIKGHNELSKYPSHYLTGTRAELKAEGHEGQLQLKATTEVSGDTPLKFIPKMQDQIARGLVPNDSIHDEYFFMKWPSTSAVSFIEALQGMNLKTVPGATADTFNLQIDMRLAGDMFEGGAHQYLYKVVDVLRHSENSLSFVGTCTEQ